MSLSKLQTDVANIIANQPGRNDFVFVGGGALIALGLVDRFTRDLDYFTREPKLIAAFAKHCQDALLATGLEVERNVDAPTFIRLKVTSGAQVLEVDFGNDHFTEVVDSEFGPTLSASDLAANKMSALFSRAERRDAFDIWKLATHFNRAELIDMARTKDPGFDVKHFAEALRAVDRFASADIEFDSDVWSHIVTWCNNWASELESGPSD